MRFVVMLIVLIFPILDVIATMRFARWTGIPMVALMLAPAIAGSLLLRHERVAFRAKTLAALRGDQPLLRGLLDSGRKVLAAILLIVPGVVSDLMALTLLLLPINLGASFAPMHAGAVRRWLDDDYRRSINPSFPLSAVIVGCAFRARQYAHSIITMPATIIGSDSHCPIDSPIASNPRKLSGSRANSTMKRKLP